jgi:hypothetical protein
VGVNLDGPWLSETRGVDGEAVRLVTATGLTALVGSVDLSRFGEEGLRRSLNDLERLEAIARAHHAVIRLAATSGPVAPARLATVYDDDGRVRDMLVRHADAFAAALRRVSGRREWGVKAYAAAEPAVTEPARPTSGTAYLRQRRVALNDRSESRQRAAAGAEAMHARLAQTAVAARQHRPQDPNLTGDDRWMTLNGAYLVDEAKSEAFVGLVSALAADHAGGPEPRSRPAR